MAVQEYYFAFISYSRKDEEHAKWLHNQFEHYNLPAHIKKIRKDLPDSFSPIFRDEDELSSGNLSEEINQALNNSNWLIVLCSPFSASSGSYVNKEIQQFIQGHTFREETLDERINHIIPIIISGKPYAENKNEECFPSTIRELRNNGKELRAPNINSTTDGWERTFIASISTMLNLPFDTLWDRRQREIEENHRTLIEVNNRISLNLSRAVSSRVRELIVDRDNILASLISIDILKSRNGILPPYCPEVESVLRMSLNNDSYKISCNAGEVIKTKWSPQETLIAALYEDNRIRIWKSNNGSSMRTYDDLIDPKTFSKVTDILWTDDESSMIFSTNDGRIYNLNLLNNKIELLYEIDFAIDSLYSHSKSEVISFLSKGRLYFLSKSTSKLVVHIGEGKGFIIDFIILKSGLIFYIKSTELYLHNVENNSFQLIDALSDDEFLKITHSPDGNFIAISTRNGYIHIYETKILKRVKSIKGQGYPIWSIEYDSTGKLIAAGDSIGCCAIWDVNTNNAQVFNIHKSFIRSCSINSNGSKLLTGSKDGFVRVTDLLITNVIESYFQPYHFQESDYDLCENRALRYIYGSNRIMSSLVFDNDVIMTASRKGIVSLWNLNSFELIEETKLHNSEIKALCLSFDKRYLISIGLDYKLKISNLTSHKLTKHLSYDGCFSCIAAHPWRHLIAAIKNDNNKVHLQLIDYIKNKVIYNIVINELEVEAINFSHSGEFLALGTDRGNIYLIKTESGNIIKIFKGHKQAVTSIVLSPIKNLIVSGSEDRTIRIWDIEKKACIKVLEGHESRIEHLSFDENGNFIISCGGDGNIATWNVERGTMLNSFHQPMFSKGIYAKYLQKKELIVYVAGELVFLWKYPSLESIIKIAKYRDEGRYLTQKDRENFFLD